MGNTIDNYAKLRMQASNVNFGQKNEIKQNIKPETLTTDKAVKLRDEFVKEKKKNGLFEKFYNWMKNTTNLGLGSKKVEQSIEQFDKGQISENDVKENIKKYRGSQINAQQILGDGASLVAGMTAYSKVSNYIQKQTAQNKLGGNLLSEFSNELKDVKYAKHIIKFFKNMSKTKRIALATTASAIAGAFVKKYIIKFDRIGSKEYKTDIPKDKEHKFERKGEQKILNYERRKANWKNFFTGGLNGIIAPLANLAGGIVGVPLVIATNLGTRYFQSQKDKDSKISIKDFADKFKDNAVMNTAAAALITVPLFKKAHYNNVLTKNIEKVVTKLKDVKLKSVFDSEKTAYTELKGMLLDSDKLSKIINGNMPVDEKITKLIDENIFAAKFIQNADNFDNLARALKENCPTSRTLDEAKKFIANTYGSKYEVTKLLGVGTVAESYLAKNTETGKEVCIKMLKKGIDTAKIDADKQKIITLIKSQVTDEKQLQYYINNIDDLASAIRKEVDLSNEMEAAKRLAKYTKKANVVKPLEIKDNVYVMEKAPGISLKTLQDISAAEAKKNIFTNSIKMFEDKAAYNEQLIQDITNKVADPAKHTADEIPKLQAEIKKYKQSADFYKNMLPDIENEITKIKSKAPDFDKVNITANEIDRLLSQYIKAQTEQFDSIYKTGKTLHGDIHPGNVFVDLKALKSGKGNALTLIDTGNIIDLSVQQSHNALKLNQYIKRGNVKDISSYVMEGAVLPANMTKEQAVENMEKELRKVFFDSESSLNYMNNDSLLALTSNIMRKYNIIPGSTQLNLEKAKRSSAQSMNEILQSFIETKYSQLDNKNPAKAALMVAKDLASWGKRFVTAQKTQEAKNMTQYPLKQIIRNANNPNMLKTNSEDYLTYKFKQNMGKSAFEKLNTIGS